jgi:8-oxo-dGTP pyrophosphatase MutT (NUDIX family)
MYLTSETIAALESRYGPPRVLTTGAEFNEREFALLKRCLEKRRAHDVTLFIRDGNRFALIRKHGYPAGLFRPPSGGIEPGETFEDGAAREALEETGLTIRLSRYLLRVQARFHHAGETVPWTTHVFGADAVTRALQARDRKEIDEACWATPEAIHAVMRPRMKALGSAGMQYRLELQDAALAILGCPPPLEQPTP